MKRRLGNLKGTWKRFLLCQKGSPKSGTGSKNGGVKGKAEGRGGRGSLGHVSVAKVVRALTSILKKAGGKTTAGRKQVTPNVIEKLKRISGRVSTFQRRSGKVLMPGPAT